MDFKQHKFSNLSADKKGLLSNFFSLSALQGLNLILPLITLPYLVRVLGVETFGLISFSLSIIMYFNVLVGFGFDLSATREISINRDNLKKVSEIFSAVMLIKFCLLIFSFFTLTILILSIESFRGYELLYFSTFGIVAGNMLFPSWFFQGMERMKYITYINVISKIVFTILIFFLVKDVGDYIFVPILNSLGVIFGGIFALFLVFKLFSIKLIFPSLIIIISQIKDSYHFFLSRVANDGSRYYAATVIGLFFGNIAVGYFAMVEKLFFAFMSIGGLVSQTLYPYMSRTKNIYIFKKIFILVTSVSLIFLFPTMYYNEIILQLVFNIKEEVLSNIFLIIFSGSIFGIISSLLGYPLLAAFGFVNYANNSLIFASILYLVYTTIVVFFFKNIYLVASSLILFNLSGLIFRIIYIYKVKLYLITIKK